MSTKNIEKFKWRDFAKHANMHSSLGKTYFSYVNISQDKRKVGL